MESRANVIAAGLFVVALTVGLVFTALWLTRDTIDRAHYLLVARVPVSGLHAKASVRLRGVDVGRVDGIRFDPQDHRVILVDIAVDREAALTQGTFGQLAFQGITGLSYVALDDEGNRPQLLATSDAAPGRIELRPSLIDGLSDSGRDLLRDAALVARRLNGALSDENLAHVVGTLRNTEAAAQQVAQLAHDLQPAARALQGLEADTRTTLQHLDLLLGDVRTATAQLGQHLHALDQVGQGAQDVGQASRALQAAMEDDALPRLSGTLDELNRSARSLQGLMNQLQQRPQSLLFGRLPDPPGPGEAGFNAPAGAGAR